MNLTADEVIVYEYEDDQFWAIYRNGRLVAHGEEMAEAFQELEKLGVLKHRIRDNSMYLGDEDCAEPAETVEEIERFNSMPDWEKEAMELEQRAKQLRERGAQRGW